MCLIFHEPIRHPCAHNKGMALDSRLNCLRIAIKEDWPELDAEESDGTLVIRLKTEEELRSGVETRKRGRPAWLHRSELE